jgi:hypothetical protein
VFGSKSVLASLALGALLLIVSAGLASAQGNGNGQGQNNNNQGNGKGLVLSATPELDSLVLFGTGLAGVAGYSVLRWRARRR